MWERSPSKACFLPECSAPRADPARARARLREVQRARRPVAGGQGLRAHSCEHERVETWGEANPEGRWRCYAYEDLLKRDKLSLDLFWIKDKSLTDTDALAAPDVLAAEIADDLAAALEQFSKIAARLRT